MSTRGPAFHILPNHVRNSNLTSPNRPKIREAGGFTSSARYAYNNSPNPVNRFTAASPGKFVSDTTLVAARASATPGDTNPYMMTL